MVNDAKKPIMKAVIREDIVALTGHHIRALILNQFLYWGTRKGKNQYTNFIEEERKRTENQCEDLEYCWIYKSVDELKQELMLVDVSATTLRRRIVEVVEKEWLFERNNPKNKWEKTKHYRLNLKKIQRELKAMGYELEGYPDVNEESIIHGEESIVLCDESKSPGEGAIPEINAETSSRNYSDYPDLGSCKETNSDENDVCSSGDQINKDNSGHSSKENNTRESSEEESDLDDRPEWMIPKSDIAVRALEACGQEYFMSKREFEAWKRIEDNMEPFKLEYTEKYPREFVEDLIKWAKYMNLNNMDGDPNGGVRIAFLQLIKGINNTVRKKQWITGEKKSPSSSNYLLAKAAVPDPRAVTGNLFADRMP